MSGSEPVEGEGVVFRDKRKIDPTTGAAREQRADSGVESEPAGGIDDDATLTGESVDAALDALEADAAQAKIVELTADIQRVQAEYSNYRKRVDRDRLAVRDEATAKVLTELLPVLDDIGRAREHGDLDGAFKLVGESLEATVAKLGLETFGVVGDAFDPTIHEALMHETADDIDVPTCITVFQPGYRLGDRLVRPARVVVADPA